jgi:two-component system, OmpR family, KDP operon response regulator KdpE
VLGVIGGVVVGDTLLFAGVVCAGVGVGRTGLAVGVSVADATTIGTGVSEAELADAADADCAATFCLMTPCVVISPWLPLTSRPTRSTAVRVTAVIRTQESSQPSASVSGRPGSRRLIAAGAWNAADASPRHDRDPGPRGPRGPAACSGGLLRSDTCPFSVDLGRSGVKALSRWRANLGQANAVSVPALSTVSHVPRLLLIEDDAAIRTSLTRSLSERGHAVASAPTAMAGLQAVVDTAPDLVVLDLGLPDLDGGKLIQMVRAVSKVPIIVATARDDQAEMVRILDWGADDYVVKPFASDHLEARIRAVLRRMASGDAAQAVVVGGLRIDQRTREASLDGDKLELTRKEFDLLLYLAEHEGEVVSKRVLLAEVWQQAYGGADKTVDVHLSWLRRKLGESAAAPRYLLSVRGVGVKLVGPSEPES